MQNKVTYRQQFTRCGKQRCRKCKEGAGHGPYWYAYWSENGRTISKYIGIHPPSDLEITTKEASKGHPSIEEAAFAGNASSGSEHPGTLNKEAASTPVKDALNVKKAAQASPGNAAGSDPILRIYLLGQFRIERRSGSEWQTVTNRTWHRRRARALLGCLLSTSSRRMGREQAMEALWPDLDIETAANRLNGAVHEARQVLEPEITRPAASRMLRLERDVLILADASQIWVDAEEFESLLNKANMAKDPEQVEQLLEEASKLYGGDYLLEELYSEWASPRRESLRRGWMGLLLKLAEMRASRGALTSAIEPLDRLLTTDPTHETAVRRLMVILTRLDRRGEALRAYRRLADTLARDYESDPLPETTAMYEALRKGTYQMPHPAENTLSHAETKTPVAPPPQTLATSSQTGEMVPAFSGFKRPILQLGRHNQSKLVGRERELDTILKFLLALEQAPQEEAIGAGYANGDIQENHSAPPRSAREQKLTHFLLLMGESGIGKTRLAEELSYQAHLRDWSVVWAHAYEQEGTIPYRPWTDILRTLLKDVSPEFLLASLKTQVMSAPGEDTTEVTNAPSTAHAKLARLSTFVPELATHSAFNVASSRLASTLPAEQERLHLWEATSGLLAVLSRSTPLLLVLDDLHWTDDSSLELLAYVVRHMHNERIAIVATCRDMELAPTSNLRTLLNDLRREQALITLPVLPLDESQIGSLVAHLPENIVQTIQSQAGGNPFFAEELARVSETGLPIHPDAVTGRAQALPTAVIETDSQAVSASASWASAMPDTITAVLDRRLSRLSNDCQTLLGKVAVLGGSFEFNQLSFMAGDYSNNEDTILDLLEEALRAGLLAEEGTGTHITYHFWHPLIVSHLYERLSAARRAQLHRRAANALIQAYLGNEAEVAADITHHLSKGGGDPMQIARYAEMAGNRAFALSAYSEAEHYYRQAINALSHTNSANEDPLHLASLLERVAECSRIHGNYEEIRHLYERVLDLRNQQNQQRPDGPKDLNSEEAHLWRQQEAQRQALIWREIGFSWAETGNFDQAWQCYQHGKQVMLDAGVTSGPAWACLHMSHGNINWRIGNNEEARRYGQEALEMLERVIEQQQEKATPPITSSELPTRTALEMIGDPLELGRCHELLGIIAATQGQYTEALEHLNRALSIFERHNHIIVLTLLYGNLGAVHAMKTEYDTARMFFKRAYAMARSNNDLPNMAFVSGNLGDVAARCGNLSEAEEWFRQSLSLAERINEREQMSWVHVVWGGALQDQGDMPGALQHMRRGLSIGRRIKSVLCIGFALVGLAEWRITRAIETCQIHLMQVDANATSQTTGCLQLLERAKLAARRALALEGLNTEVAIEGQLSLASAHFLLGEIEEAQDMALQSMHAAQKHELTRIVARAQRLLGRILAAQGQSTEADAYFEQCLDTFSRYEMRLDYARALHGYGVTLLQRSTAGEGNARRGLDYLLEALNIFKQCKASIDVLWVERILANLAYENAQV